MVFLKFFHIGISDLLNPDLLRASYITLENSNPNGFWYFNTQNSE